MRNLKRPVPTESKEMQVLAEYLDLKGYLWCHVPNEGRRSLRAGARLRKEGLKRGVPDVLIFSPVRIAIELKRVKGSRVTGEQLQWLDSLSKWGWYDELCHGADEAIRFIEKCVKKPMLNTRGTYIEYGLDRVVRNAWIMEQSIGDQEKTK